MRTRSMMMMMMKMTVGKSPLLHLVVGEGFTQRHNKYNWQLLPWEDADLQPTIHLDLLSFKFRFLSAGNCIFVMLKPGIFPNRKCICHSEVLQISHSRFPWEKSCCRETDRCQQSVSWKIWATFKVSSFFVKRPNCHLSLFRGTNNIWTFEAR